MKRITILTLVAALWMLMPHMVFAEKIWMGSPDFIVNDIAYYIVRDSETKSVTVVKNNSKVNSGTIIIPSSVYYNGNTYKVEGVNVSAFQDCYNLTSVHLPSSIKNIDEKAFCNCSSLESVNIPNSVSSIESKAFYGCSKLANLNIPNSVTNIGSYAFYGCSFLSNIVMPNSLTDIGICAFKNCEELESIIIPEGVKTLKEELFNGCKKLACISLPNSLESIDKNAFKNCSSLNDITFKNNITSIAYWAFDGCTSLNSITIEALTPPSAYSLSFVYEFSSKATLYVPYTAINDYKNAYFWKNIQNIEAISSTEPSRDPDASKYIYAKWIGGSIMSINDKLQSGSQLNWTIYNKSTENITLTGIYLIDGLTGSVGNNMLTTSETVLAGSSESYTTTIGALGIYSPSIRFEYTYKGVTGYTAEAKYESNPSIGDDDDNPSGGGGSDTPGESDNNPDVNVSELANAIYINKADVNRGSIVEIPIFMKNADIITGFEFNLSLPSGISVELNEDEEYEINLSEERTTARNHNIFDSVLKSDGTIYVLCNSSKSKTFCGNDGEVAVMTLNVDKDMKEGVYPIVFKNVILTDAQANSIKLGDLKFSITVKAYKPGDANGDGEVNGSDITAIANHLLGYPNSNYEAGAADANGDGEVNGSDITAVANILLYGNVKGNQ